MVDPVILFTMFILVERQCFAHSAHDEISTRDVHILLWFPSTISLSLLLPAFIVVDVIYLLRKKSDNGEF